MNVISWFRRHTVIAHLLASLLALVLFFVWAPAAILLMALVSFLCYRFFKHRKWL